MLYNGLYKELCSGFRNGRERGTLSGTFNGLESASGSATGGSIYEAETMAWVKQLSIRPSAQYLLAVDSLIFSLKKASIWDQLDRLWIFATEQQAHARVSLVNPNGIKTTWPTNITEGGSPNWTAKRGYTGNGTSMYLNTNYTPSTNAKNYSLNSACIGFYSIGSGDAGNKFPHAMGAIHTGVGHIYLLPWVWNNLTSQWYAGWTANTDTQSTIANGAIQPSQKGMFVSSRFTPSTTSLFREGAWQGTFSVASTGIPAYPIFIMCTNQNGTPGSYSKNQFSMAFVGSGTIDQAKFYAIIQDFATKIGFKV